MHPCLENKALLIMKSCVVQASTNYTGSRSPNLLRCLLTVLVRTEVGFFPINREFEYQANIADISLVLHSLFRDNDWYLLIFVSHHARTNWPRGELVNGSLESENSEDVHGASKMNHILMPS